MIVTFSLLLHLLRLLLLLSSGYFICCDQLPPSRLLPVLSPLSTNQLKALSNVKFHIQPSKGREPSLGFHLIDFSVQNHHVSIHHSLQRPSPWCMSYAIPLLPCHIITTSHCLYVTTSTGVISSGGILYDCHFVFISSSPLSLILSSHHVPFDA